LASPTVAQRVVVVAVFIAAGDGKDALGEELRQAVLDQQRVAPFARVRGQPAGQIQAQLDLAKQRQSAVGGNASAAESGDNFAATGVCKTDVEQGTLCHGQPHGKMFANP
jgi:hypothetical protein